MTKQTCEIEKLLMGTPEDVLIGIVMLFKTYGTEELWKMRKVYHFGSDMRFYTLPFKTRYNLKTILASSKNFCIIDTGSANLAITNQFKPGIYGSNLYINLDENE